MDGELSWALGMRAAPMKGRGIRWKGSGSPALLCHPGSPGLTHLCVEGNTLFDLSPYILGCLSLRGCQEVHILVCDY